MFVCLICLFDSFDFKYGGVQVRDPSCSGNGLPGARLWRSRRPWGRCAGPAAPTRGCAARRHPLATSASARSRRGSPWRAGKALMRRVELAVQGRRPVVAGSARSPCPRCGARPGGPRAALRTWLRWARRPRGRRGRRTARRTAAPEGGRAGALRALTNDIQLQAVLRALLRAPSHCARARVLRSSFTPSNAYAPQLCAGSANLPAR